MPVCPSVCPSVRLFAQKGNTGIKSLTPQMMGKHHLKASVTVSLIFFLKQFWIIVNYKMDSKKEKTFTRFFMSKYIEPRKIVTNQLTFWRDHRGQG